MAVINAAATGNWSSTATWPGGTLPTENDDVHANGYTVTIDQNITVLSLRTTQGSGGVAGGTFLMAAGDYTVTADIIAGSEHCLQKTTSGTLTVIGDITGGTSASKNGAYANTGTGFFELVGNITGGSNTNAYGVQATCQAEITGDITGGTFSGAEGLRSYVYDVSVTGNISGGSGISATGMYHGGNSSLIDISIVGNISGGTSYGLWVQYIVGSCIISGDIIAWASYGIYFSHNMAANTISISGRLVGNGQVHAVYNNTGTAFSFSGDIVASSAGYFPVFGAVKILSDAGNNIQMPNTAGGTDIFQVSPYPTDYPAAGDVRNGISYNHATQEGTCAVPIPDHVSLNIPVDDTVGKAVLRAVDIGIDLTPITDALNEIKNIAGTSGFDRTTDSLEAIRNRVDDVMVATGTPSGYSPTSAVRTIGSDQGGTYADLESHDAVFFATGEVSGTGLDVLVTRSASEITENPSLVRVSGYYAGSPSHWLDVQLCDYVTDSWETKGRMTNLSESFNYLFPMSPDNHDLSTGEMKIRFLHNVTTYFTNHRLYLDFISFEKVSSNSQIASDLAAISAKTAQLNFSAGKVLARNEDSEKIASQGSVDAIDSLVDAIEVNVSNLSSTLEQYGDGHIFSALALQNAPVCDLNGVALEDTALAILAQTDVKTSTRLAALDYAAPDNASITAIKAKTDNLPSDPADESLIEAAIDSAEEAILTAISNITDATNPGIGLYPVNVSVTDSGLTPIGSVRIEIWNLAETARLASGYTDAGGTASFNLDEGTYKIRVSLIGYDFTFNSTLVHEEPSTAVEIIGEPISIGTPGDSSLCRVWMWCFDEAGQNPLPHVKATAYLINNPVFHEGKCLKATTFPPVYDSNTGKLYWDIPRLVSAHLIVQECLVDNEVTIPDTAEESVESLLT